MNLDDDEPFPRYMYPPNHFDGLPLDLSEPKSVYEKVGQMHRSKSGSVSVFYMTNGATPALVFTFVIFSFLAFLIVLAVRRRKFHRRDDQFLHGVPMSKA